MDDIQQNFYNFYLSRVQDDKIEDAKLILLNNFKMQDEGTFSREAMAEVLPKMLSYLKREHVDEFNKAQAHMSSTLKD